MVPNRATHHIWLLYKSSSLDFSKFYPTQRAVFLSTMIMDLPTVTDKHESFYNIYQYSIFHINLSNLAISSPLSLTKFKNPLDNSVSANAELMTTNASQKHP